MKGLRVVAVAAVVLGASASLLGCFAINSLPVASFTRSPSSGQAPLDVRFDATRSADADGTIVRYDWTFGDGGEASGPETTHVYESPGLYEAVLAVTDNRGASASRARMVDVVDPNGGPPVGPEVGKKAPPFTLPDLDGNEVSLLDFHGGVVLLDFWASACTPCRTTLPWLEKLRAQYAGQGLVLLGVCLDSDVEGARAFLEASGCQMLALWGSLAAAEGVKALYGVDRIPRTFLIDRQGVVRYVDHPIRLRERDIEPWL